MPTPESLLSPPRGSAHFCTAHPQDALWAALWRGFAAAVQPVAKLCRRLAARSGRLKARIYVAAITAAADASSSDCRI